MVLNAQGAQESPATGAIAAIHTPSVAPIKYLRISHKFIGWTLYFRSDYSSLPLHIPIIPSMTPSSAFKHSLPTISSTSTPSTYLAADPMPTFWETAKAAWSIRNFFQLPLLEWHCEWALMGFGSAGLYLTESIFSYDDRAAKMGDIITLSIFFQRKGKITNLPGYL